MWHRGFIENLVWNVHRSDGYQSVYLMKHIFFIPLVSLLLSPSLHAQSERPFKLESLVGYYNVGVKPNKPFFKSRWYMRDGELYAIFDSDIDRRVKIFEDGELTSNVFLNEENIPEIRNDTTYYLILNFEEGVDKLSGFKILRPRSEWPTDLYAYRDTKLDAKAVDTEASLTEELVTENFSIQYSSLEKTLVNNISQILEKHYHDLLSDFRLSELRRTVVRIYPEKEVYNNAVLTPNAPLWQMGRVWDKNEIRMLSPITAQQLLGEDLDVNELVLHEFVHALHLNLLKDGVNAPGWLWEGLALYKGCCQWVTNPFDLEYMKKGKYPSLKKIERDRTYELKYDLGFYLIEYLHKAYGWDRILELIHHNGNIESTLGVSEKSFETSFYQYLEAEYK